MEEKSAHEQVAAKETRDEHGHFIHVEQSIPNNPNHSNNNPVENFISKASSDDIIDVSVHNPLHKIVQLLTEIKREKAFSFTFKGSLGIAGVALVLGVFGIFGGGQILCDRGVQSEIGTIKVLNIKEEKAPAVPVFENLISFLSPFSNSSDTSNLPNRTVLIKNDQTVISLSGKSLISNHSSSIINNGYPVIATGNYNSCSQTLTLTDPNGLQPLSP